ncbi:unnamed protein product [Prorocentrum cordatum]|uniref:Mei2-like C-terminal RNA recognition motif domain-containing protein n=1 Tax=Prorocentrum cordatum TaxID=2364126 RepID=A0ABN9USR2_9DINO|nr:unnamed protein product [Polarella glacialis]
MGYSKQFDFVYVPVKFTTMIGLGYAFVNWTTHENAKYFRLTFGGFEGWLPPTSRGGCCKVSWSRCQGFCTNIARYQNSAVMSSSVPASCKPVLLKEGVQISFPEPTRQLRKLRYRRLTGEAARASSSYEA